MGEFTIPPGYTSARQKPVPSAAIRLFTTRWNLAYYQFVPLPSTPQNPTTRRAGDGKVHLTGAQLRSLCDALRRAFPSESALAQLVKFQLNEDLNAIAQQGPLGDMAFNLL